MRYLLEHDGEPVQLDQKVMGRPGPADVTLQYDCGKAGGCSIVRIQSPTDAFSRLDGGVWIQGCYRVTRDGNGYAAEGLDIELHEQGATCAS